MKTEWNMPRAADVCLGCGRAFQVGQTIQTCLFETPAGYQRQDYCAGCPPPDNPPPVGAWQTRRAEPGTRHAATFDREAILEFFERLADAQDPRHVQLRFVLALLLWRKKLLKLERTLDTGASETWEFVAARSGAAYRVARPELDEHEIERLSVQLEQVLTDPAGVPPTGVLPQPQELTGE